MGLTPNQKLVLDLLGYLPILVFGVAVVDALHWIWQWNRGLLTPLQRRKRLRRYGVFFAAGMGVLAASQFTRDFLADRLWWHTAALAVLFVAAVLMVLLHPMYRRPTEKDVERHFGLNPRHCGRCDYDLTGNISGVCPECGWVIPATPMRVEEPNWWCWWKKWGIEYLERWRTAFVLHVFIVLSSFGLAAATLFVHTLLKPVVIIDPLTGMGRLHRLGFVYILPACALVMLVLGLHMTINLIRIALYRLRRNGGQ